MTLINNIDIITVSRDTPFIYMCHFVLCLQGHLATFLFNTSERGNTPHDFNYWQITQNSKLNPLMLIKFLWLNPLTPNDAFWRHN